MGETPHVVLRHGDMFLMGFPRIPCPAYYILCDFKSLFWMVLAHLE